MESLVGTGPFQWGKYEPGSSLPLDRFDGCWGQKPKIDQIYLVLKADFRAALLAISMGELDATYVDDTDLALKLQKNDPNLVRMKAASGQAVNWLAFNMKRKPSDDIRVRQYATPSTSTRAPRTSTVAWRTRCTVSCRPSCGASPTT